MNMLHQIKFPITEDCLISVTTEEGTRTLERKEYHLDTVFMHVTVYGVEEGATVSVFRPQKSEQFIADAFRQRGFK